MSILAERLTAQLLAGPPVHDPVAVVERLLAVQAQDARGARLAIRARSTGFSAREIDTGLTEHRSLLVTWLNRGTLHLVRTEDYPWLHALTTPQLATANARRLAEEGVSTHAAERGVTAIVRALAEEGPLERDRLRERLVAARVVVAGQAFVHLLALASLRGLIVRGPMVGGMQAFALVRDWLGELVAVDPERALGELARRYLAGHGPASDRDLARWAGVSLRTARAGLNTIASELRERSDGLVELSGRPRAAPLPQPRLLGAFEPVLLGWTSREVLLGDAEARVVSGGIFRAFALVHGRAVATWRITGERVVLDYFRSVGREERSLLENEGQALIGFLAG